MTRARRARTHVSYVATSAHATSALAQRVVGLAARIHNLVIERALLLTAGASFNAAVSLASAMS